MARRKLSCSRPRASTRSPRATHRNNSQVPCLLGLLHLRALVVPRPARPSRKLPLPCRLLDFSGFENEGKQGICGLLSGHELVQPFDSAKRSYSWGNWRCMPNLASPTYREHTIKTFPWEVVGPIVDLDWVKRVMTIISCPDRRPFVFLSLGNTATKPQTKEIKCSAGRPLCS